MEHNERAARPVARLFAVVTAMAIVAAACGGDDDDTAGTPDTTALLVDSTTPSTTAPPDTTVPPETTETTVPTGDDGAPAEFGAVRVIERSALPDGPDLATIGLGATVVASNSYDPAITPGTEVINGDSGWNWVQIGATGQVVVALAHTAVDSIVIDTEEIPTDGPGGDLSPILVLVEHGSAVEGDIVWEQVVEFEPEPTSLTLVETPGLVAGYLRLTFTSRDGGVAVGEVMAFGELGDDNPPHAFVETARLAGQQVEFTVDGNAGAEPGTWWLTINPDDAEFPVVACTSAGGFARLAPRDGALVGEYVASISADPADAVEIVISSADQRVINVSVDGDRALLAYPVFVDGADSCVTGDAASDTADGAADDVIVPDTVPADEREAEPLLVVGAARGDLDEVRTLLEAGADPNVARDSDGWTALLFAAQDGYTDIVDELIAAGARIDQGTDDDWTALMIASQNGHDDTVAALLAAGANPRVGRSTNWTALHSAVLRNHPSVVDQLLAAGAPTEAAEDGYTPLTIAAQEGNDAIVTLLLDVGARADGAPASGPTPLYMAAQNGHASAAQLLIDGGADPDNGGTDAPPIVVAAARGNGGVIQVVADAGANIDEPRDDGMTALHWAANNDDAATAQLLVDLGADPTVTNAEGDTPLDLAIRLDADAAASVLRGG